MQKTKLGISVGALAAITYLGGMIGGILVAILLAGYILLFEENAWLRRSAVKAVALIAFFSVIIAIIDFIPDTTTFFENIINAVGVDFRLQAIHLIIDAVTIVIGMVEKILLLVLGIKALSLKTITVPSVDGIVNKHMN